MITLSEIKNFFLTGGLVKTSLLPYLSDDDDNFLLGKEDGDGSGDVTSLSPSEANGVISKSSTLTYASTITPNFNDLFVVRTIALTGNLTFGNASNKANGKEKIYILEADGSSRTLTFPASWRWPGDTKPTDIASGKLAVLSLYCYGTTEATIIASYSVEA